MVVWIIIFHNASAMCSVCWTLLEHQDLNRTTPHPTEVYSVTFNVQNSAYRNLRNKTNASVSNMTHNPTVCSTKYIWMFRNTTPSWTEPWSPCPPHPIDLGSNRIFFFKYFSVFDLVCLTPDWSGRWVGVVLLGPFHWFQCVRQAQLSTTKAFARKQIIFEPRYAPFASPSDVGIVRA